MHFARWWHRIKTTRQFLSLFIRSSLPFSLFFSTKHVSFARSHTLTSFDEASVVRSASRITTTKSQERLIGGKKPSIVSHGAQQQPPPSQQSSLPQTVQALAIQSRAIQFHHHHQHHHQQQPAQVVSVSQTPPPPLLPLQLSSSSLSCHQPQMPEIVSIEKVKRGSMKAQATQTGVYLDRKTSINSHLSLSPRTMHRVSARNWLNGFAAIAASTPTTTVRTPIYDFIQPLSLLLIT